MRLVSYRSLRRGSWGKERILRLSGPERLRPQRANFLREPGGDPQKNDGEQAEGAQAKIGPKDKQ
jgi:hypothetical protein